MRLDVGSGSYAFRCLFDDYDPITGPTAVVGGHASGTPAILPITSNDLLAPAREYHAYVAAGLNTLASQAGALAADVRSGNLGAAKTAWLPAHLTYERLGAAYDSFGNFDQEIDGRPDGLAGGVNSPQWTGFYRLEYGLWHGQSAAELTGIADTLDANVRALQTSWPSTEINLLDIGLRTHEILENALEFQLTGHDDYGSGTTLATTQANITGTLELLTILHPLLVARYAALPAVYTWLDRLNTLLNQGQDAERAVDPRVPADGEQPRADRLGLRSGPRGTSTDRRHHRTADYLMPEPTPPDAPRPQPAAGPASPRRRAFLLGGLGAGAAGAVAGVAGGYAYRATRAAPAGEVALENAQAGCCRRCRSRASTRPASCRSRNGRPR